MLEKTLQILLSPGQKFDNGEQNKNDINDALFYIDLLRDNITVDARNIFGVNSEESEFEFYFRTYI